MKGGKGDLVIPATVRRRAGIRAGDQLECKVSGGIINIIPKLPSADDEYTADQRRKIDAELDQAAKGPYYGPFETADAAINSWAARSARGKTRKQPSEGRFH